MCYCCSQLISFAIDGKRKSTQGTLCTWSEKLGEGRPLGKNILITNKNSPLGLVIVNFAWSHTVFHEKRPQLQCQFIIHKKVNKCCCYTISVLRVPSNDIGRKWLNPSQDINIFLAKTHTRERRKKYNDRLQIFY